MGGRHSWRNASLENAIMDLKDTDYRIVKTRRRKKRHDRRKPAGYAGFQVSITCLSWVTVVTKALIRFLVELRCVFMCTVCLCAGGERGRERV